MTPRPHKEEWCRCQACQDWEYEAHKSYIERPDPVEEAEFAPIPRPGDLVQCSYGGMYVEDDSLFAAQMRQRESEYFDEHTSFGEPL